MTHPQRQPYMQLASSAMAGLRQCKAALANGTLGPLIELVYLRVSQINGCSYCLHMHANALREQGESQQRLDHVAGWHSSSLFSERERAALLWAESLTLLPTSHAADDDYELLQAAFTPQEISELTVAIGLMNALNRVAVGMRQ